MRAASLLHIAQPALTRQIQQLEDDVGVRLFERVRRGVELTPAGVALLEASRMLFERIELAVQHAREADEGTRGLLRVGLGRIAIDHPIVGRALAAGRARYPGLRLEGREVPSWDQPCALRSRDVDLAVGAVDYSAEDGITSEFLCEDVVDTAVVPSSHPIALHPVVGLEQLFELRHLTLDTPLGTFPRLFEALQKRGLKCFERYSTIETVYNLVAAGRGWTCATHAMRVHPPRGTTLVTVRDFSLAVPIYVGWRDTDESHAISNLVCALLEEMGRPHATRGRAGPVGARSDRGADRVAASVDLEQLRTLATVLEDGSVSRAAVRLRLSQPGVTRRLHALERATGLDLVRRLPHGMVGTAAGQALGSEANELLRLAQRAMTRARHAAEGITDSYTIATLPLELAGHRVLHALQQIHQLPHLEVSVREMISEQALRAVNEGRVDVALIARIPGIVVDPALASVHLDDDSIDCVLVPESHPLAKRAWLTARDLADEPFVFITREASPLLHDSVMRALGAIGLRPRSIGTFDGPRAMWRAAVDSAAWTIGRRSQRPQPPTGLVAVPLEGLHVPCGNMLVWRRDEHNAGLRQVVELFRASQSHAAAT